MPPATPDVPRPRAPPSRQEVPAAALAPHERIVIVPTQVYWLALTLTLVFLSIAYGFYDDYLPTASTVLQVPTYVLAAIVLLWAIIGLSRRGRIVHRSVAATRALSTSVSDTLRNRSEANEGAASRFVTKWTARVAKLVKLVRWVVLLPWRIVVWAWYTSETIAWRLVLVFYDILYYPVYAAWLIAHWAARTAWRMTYFLLRVAWKILRIPLFLPFIRTWWRQKKRPEILAAWDVRVQAFRHARAAHLDRRRRLAHARGHDPDHWEADWRLRRGFPLPHPEKGRVAIRKRIAHIREIQKLRREGKPVPRRRRRPSPSEEPSDAHEAPQKPAEKPGARLGPTVGSRPPAPRDA